jgi:hypothetical protein
LPENEPYFEEICGCCSPAADMLNNDRSRLEDHARLRGITYPRKKNIMSHNEKRKSKFHQKIRTVSKRAYEKENSHGPRAVFPMNIMNSFVSISAAWKPVGKKPKTTLSQIFSNRLY